MNRDRTLRPYTIIPPSLYVRRNADRQLAEIIEDMGRPGYVLVARQMGKTNLLLNAKREMDGGAGAHAFVYIDLSNSIPSLSEFFQWIIDQIVTSHPAKFSHLASELKMSRSDPVPLTHKEHEAELLLLLRSFSGRIVICLDEIDALTRTHYSDNVFAFIRSIYFSGRANFAEFERLTYVLSGVAEPAEIIKNRAISPFNIGEKIYLEDFSYEEVSSLVAVSGISLDEPSLGRVYHWTAGNPRMTWDLLSSLEGDLLTGGSINPDAVDDHVSKRYLQSFDLSPVDHMRTLVAQDRDLRQAVMSIHYGKAATISDSIRTRLYLAGITTPPLKGGETRIKNPIVEEALSERWLVDTEKSSGSLRERSRVAYDSERYGDAVGLLEELISTPGEISDIELTYFQLGHSYFHLGRYADAIRALSVRPINPDRLAELWEREVLWIGISHLLLSDSEASAHHLERLRSHFDGLPKSKNYYECITNLAAAYRQIGTGADDKALALAEEVVNNREEVERLYSSRNEAAETLYVAHFNLHRLLLKRGKYREAAHHLNCAIEMADERAKVGLLIERAESEKNSSSVDEALSSAVTFVVGNQLHIEPDSALRPFAYSNGTSARLLVALSVNRRLDLARTLLNHVEATSKRTHVGAWTVLQESFNQAVTLSLIDAAVKLADLFPEYAPSSAAGDDDRQTLTVALLITPPTGKQSRLIDLYLNSYWSPTKPSFVATDFRLVYGIVTAYRQAGFISQARSLYSSAKQALGLLGPDPTQSGSEFGRLLFEFLELYLTRAEGTSHDASGEQVMRLATLIRSYKGELPPYFAPDMKSALLSQTLALRVRENKNAAPSLRSEKIGRNVVVTVRFKDGTSKSGKYKKFEYDLKLERCELVDK